MSEIVNKPTLAVLSEDNNTNDFLYVSSEINHRASRTTIIGEFYIDGFNPILELYKPEVVNTVTEIVVSEEETVNVRYLVKLNNDVFVSYLLLNQGDDDQEIITNVSFLFHEDRQAEVTILIDKLEVTDPSEDGEEGARDLNFSYSLTIDNGDIRLEPFFDVDVDFTNIKYFYEKEVLNEVSDALNAINEENKGIIIIEGERGVGKTNLIKYMVSNIDISKKVVYVPVQLFDVFNTNDINRFLSYNPHTVFILDDYDVDDYTSERTISSIVHLVDGYKSDIYNCSFIIGTQNGTIPELFASNNLHGIIEIDKLSEVKAKALCKQLKIKYVADDLKLVSILKPKSTKLISKIGY